MRRILIPLLAIVALAQSPRAAASEPEAPNQQAYQALSDSVTTAVATAIGEIVKQNIDNLAHAGVNIDHKLFAEKFVLAIEGKSTGMTVKEANDLLNDIFAAQAAQATLDAAQQQAYVDAAAATEGAITLPTGTAFIVLTEGEGPMPKADDTVSVTYTGRLADGTVFDSTEEAVSFPVGRLVPGFSEGLQHMRPGGTYRLVIPASAAYGTEGVPGAIPGNAALDFTVTLQQIEKK